MLPGPGLVGLLLAGPRRVARWVGANPLRTAGAAGALLAAWVVLASLVPGPGVDAGLSTVTADRAVRFALAHPAYPAAVVVGLGTLLLTQ